MKTHAPTPGSSFRTPGRLGWLLLLPALALSLPAQTGPEMDIERAAAVVSWQVSETNYIVLSSANPTNGPWYPVLDPIAYGPGTCQIAVRTTDHSQYFRLAQGERFQETDWDLAEWTIDYVPPEWSSDVTLEVTNGHLHVYGTSSAYPQATSFTATNLMMDDFAMSIDILGWDESVAGDNPSVGLLGRMDPASDPNGDRWGYAGILNVIAEDPAQSVLRLWEYTGDGQQGGAWAIPRVHPSKDYRLVFYCVGSAATVQLFDLTDGALVAECKATDTTRTNGSVGFMVFEIGSSGSSNFTVDNFVVVGTTP